MKPLSLSPREPGRRDGLVQAGSKLANQLRGWGSDKEKLVFQEGIPRSVKDQGFLPLTVPTNGLGMELKRRF